MARAIHRCPLLVLHAKSQTSTQEKLTGTITTETCLALINKHLSANNNKLKCSQPIMVRLCSLIWIIICLQLVVQTWLLLAQMIQKWPGLRRPIEWHQPTTEVSSTLMINWLKCSGKCWRQEVLEASSACSVFSRSWMITVVVHLTFKNFGRLSVILDYLCLKRSVDCFSINLISTKMAKCSMMSWCMRWVDLWTSLEKILSLGLSRSLIVMVMASSKFVIYKVFIMQSATLMSSLERRLKMKCWPSS